MKSLNLTWLLFFLFVLFYQHYKLHNTNTKPNNLLVWLLFRNKIEKYYLAFLNNSMLATIAIINFKQFKNSSYLSVKKKTKTKRKNKVRKKSSLFYNKKKKKQKSFIFSIKI